MLTYSFSNIGSDSMYRYLYKCIKNDIISQNLNIGYKLPSKRAFAKNLGISVITVENAYAELIAEGYIYSIPKKGFFVADIKNSIHKSESKIKTENLVLSSGEDKYIADFTSNQTDTNIFPFSVWSKIVREVLKENQNGLLTNPPCGGIMSLRVAITKHLKDFRGISVKPEQIIIGAGTEYLYSIIIQLLGFEKVYAFENPGYHKIAKIYEKHNVKCNAISMDEYGISIDELESTNSDIAHISPSHHFPTGKIMPVSRRYELLGWASKSDSRYIIEDDYDSELRMTGNPIPTMLSIDMSEKIIYINTFAKTLASTVRISYMILPKHLAEKFYSEMAFYSCTVSNFEQYTLSKFINDGYFEKHINRMRNYYHNKRDVLLDKLKSSKLKPYISILEENAGLHFVLKIDTKISDEDFCRIALKNSIKINPLSIYYYNESEPKNSGCFIINYSSIKEENIDEAVNILYDIIKK